MAAVASIPPAAIVQRGAVQSRVILQTLFKQAADGIEGRADVDLELPDFIAGAWHVVEPSVPHLSLWHTDCIAEHVQAALEGQITRLVINAPPRMGKSLPVSVFSPVWDWTKRPWRKFIMVSYAQDLATKHSVDRRLIIRSPWYQERWGHLYQLAGDQDLKREFSNDQRGHMVARGTGAGVTGYGADVIILDDPLNPELSESEAERRNVRDYFDRTLYSRLDDKKKGVIILNEQRLNAKDLTGHFLGQEAEGWVHLCLPAEAPDRQVIVFPRSKREVVREQNAPLCPEREDAATLERTRVARGSRVYNAQWQQSPTGEQGNIFKRKDWRIWTRMPDRFDQVVQSWDMTFKDTDGTDFVVGQVWGLLQADRYLLAQARGRLSFSKSIEAVRTICSSWPKAFRKLVEAKANGPAVCNVLNKEIGGFIEIEPEGGKLARAYAAQPFLEAGNLWIPDPEAHAWVEDFVSECAAFPDGDHDDQVDAMTQLIVWAAQSGKASWASSNAGLYGRPAKPDWA